MERCSMHLLYITELRFYIRVIFDAYVVTVVAAGRLLAFTEAKTPQYVRAYWGAVFFSVQAFDQQQRPASY